MIVSVSQDKTVRISDINNGKTLKTKSYTSTPICLDINSNDTNFIVGYKNGDVRLWSLADQQESTHFPKLHQDKIQSCQFVRNSAKFITASLDNELKVTDMRS